MKLGEICEKIGDGLHGTPEYDTRGNYYFINGNNIKNGKIIITGNTKMVNQVEYDKHKKNLDTNTILLSINGTIGNLAKYNGELCILGKSAAYLNIKKDASRDYVYYLMLDNRFQNNISNDANGSTIKNVSLAQLRNYRVLLPSIPEQKAIAEVLSSLDDKIDLLHRQNKTLEDMAQVVFRGRFINNSDKNKWGIRNLEEVIENYDSKRVPVAKMKRDEMKTGKLYPYYGAAQIMDYVNDYIFEGEYILMAEDGTVKTDEGYPVMQYATGKFWVNNHTHVLKAKKPYSNFFLWHFLLRHNIESIITGAVQPKINQANLNTIKIPKVPQQKADKFQQELEATFDKILSNRVQIRTLKDLRGMLLPKLVSGEICLKEFSD